MGGWNALLYKSSKWPHPGTFDVDLLLPPAITPEQVKLLVSEFFSSGFSRSAKHEFQLLKSFQIGNVPFTFNVDLLHPWLEAENPTLFQDLMNLGIPISEFDSSSAKMKSIVIRGVDELVWQHGTKRELSFNELKVHARTPDPSAFVLSKAFALDAVKRPRDSYDVFVVMEGVGPINLADSIYELSINSSTARSGLEALRKSMQSKRFTDRFRDNDFLRDLDFKFLAELDRVANSVCDQFLARTDRYPEGVNPLSG